MGPYRGRGRGSGRGAALEMSCLVRPVLRPTLSAHPGRPCSKHFHGPPFLAARCHRDWVVGLGPWGRRRRLQPQPQPQTQPAPLGRRSVPHRPPRGPRPAPFPHSRTRGSWPKAMRPSYPVGSEIRPRDMPPARIESQLLNGLLIRGAALSHLPREPRASRSGLTGASPQTGQRTGYQGRGQHPPPQLFVRPWCDERLSLPRWQDGNMGRQCRPLQM